ncbi:hypothetical protein SOVF_059630 [Spinacia oleracea]|nr:hypothetical protein SOVF_059630 [Spinacia oleracea]
MAEVDPPEQPRHIQTRRAQSFTSLSSFFAGPESPTHPSLPSLSDSEPDSCDLDPKPDPIFEPDRSSSQNAFISDGAIGLGLGLGLGTGLGDPNCEFSGEGERIGGLSDKDEVDLELGLGLGADHDAGLNPSYASPMIEEPQHFEGLRIVNIDDSDSDSEDGDHHHRGFGGVSDFDRPPYCWDYLGFNNGNRSENVETQERESDVGSVVNDNFDAFFVEEEGFVVVEDDDLGTPIQLDTDVSNVFDTYQLRAEQQEIAIDSDTDEGGELGVEEAIRDLEWEILLAVNNFNREVYDMDFNVNMYEAILGEVEEHMNDWRGSPPAADSVIVNLPSVTLSCEVLKVSEVVCAICKDEVSEEEVVKQLPCFHYYHGECIVPWLRIRNTCPVCRHELPTDDAEYEFRKREREMEEGLNVDANEDLSPDSQLHRHLTDDPRCVRCHDNKVETLLHLLRDCPAARSVWASVGEAANYPSFYTGDLQTWLIRNLQAEGLIFCEKWPTCFALTLWWNWKWRNNLCFGRGSEIPIDTESFLHARIEGTWEAIHNNNQANTNTSQANRREILISWCNPPNGWIALNTDGASKGSPGPAGGGGALRDQTGCFIKGFAANFGLCSSYKAELLAASIGLEMAKNMGIEKLVLQMDNQACLEALQNDEYQGGECFHIISKCRSLLASSDWEDL